jgi:4,5-dihydroxyphthalate decarboxylase
MTAAVVVRGFLRDYGLSPADIRWKVGEAERTKSLEFPLGHSPDGVAIELLPPGRTLESRLLDSQIDAMISLRVPAASKGDPPRIRHLFPDPAAEERAWFRRSRVFPIMHAVGVRASLAEEHPGLTRRIYDAFLAAKDLAVSEMEVIQAPKITLPWPHAALAEARSVIGSDPWPYGLSANRHVLDAQLRWSLSDGLQARPVSVEELFALDCMET